MRLNGDLNTSWIVEGGDPSEPTLHLGDWQGRKAKYLYRLCFAGKVVAKLAKSGGWNPVSM